MSSNAEEVRDEAGQRRQGVGLCERFRLAVAGQVHAVYAVLTTQQFVLFSPVFDAAADTMQQDHRRAHTVHPVTGEPLGISDVPMLGTSGHFRGPRGAYRCRRTGEPHTLVLE